MATEYEKDVTQLLYNAGISEDLKDDILHKLNGDIKNFVLFLISKGFTEDFAQRIWRAFWYGHSFK